MSAEEERAERPLRVLEEEIREAFETAPDMMGGLMNVYALGQASREVTEAEEIAGAEALHEATWGTLPIKDERYWVETRKQARAVLVAAREVRP